MRSRIFDFQSIEFTISLFHLNQVTLKTKFVVSHAFKSVDAQPSIDLIEKPSSIGVGEILSSIIPIISSFLVQLAFTFSHKN